MNLQIPDGPLQVLCLGAHPDDIEIGCGGALLQLSRRPDTTMTAIVLTSTDDREAETRKALAQFFPGSSVFVHGLPDGRLPSRWLDVKTTLEHAAAELTARGSTPSVIFTPRVDDAHQDHRLVGQLTPTVWRNSLVLHYEIAKWDGDLAPPNVFVGIDVADARRKVDLLSECFPSQLTRDWWDDEFFFALMRLRGVESRHRYAEGFTVTKALLDLGRR